MTTVRYMSEATTYREFITSRKGHVTMTHELCPAAHFPTTKFLIFAFIVPRQAEAHGTGYSCLSEMRPDGEMVTHVHLVPRSRICTISSRPTFNAYIMRHSGQGRQYLQSKNIPSQYLLTFGAEPFLRNCQLCSHSGNSQQF
jgi:hypothetical protein